MDKSTIDRSNLFRKGIMTLLTILVIVYVVYVVGRASFTQIRTESAKQMTVYNSVNTTGYFVRDEKLIDYNGKGVVSYVADDGEKVSKGETIASVFESNTAANATKEIQHLESQIASLRQLRRAPDTIAETPDMIDKDIDSVLSQINLSLCDGKISDVRANTDDILYKINERQLVTGKLSGLDEKIEQLESRIAKLKKESGTSKSEKTISSAATGYFVSKTDGYEGIYKSSDLGKLYPSNFDPNKITQKSVDSNVIGKTIEGVYWYIVCEVSADDAFKIKNSDSLSVEVPFASNEKINVELYKINQKSKTDNAIVILRGSYMNAEMANVRNEEVSIIIDTYSGIYVPKSAVHDAKVTRTVETDKGKEKTESKTVSGVYVRIGTEIEFKQIVPLYSGEDFIICMSNPDDEMIYSDDVGVLRLYDEVVVEGANLYDGKIVNRSS